MEATAQTPVTARRDALVERLVESCGGAFDLFALYLGDRLGFYEALAAGGPMTPPDLAAETGTAERYVREWLEQQAVTGTVMRPDTLRRYAEEAGSREVEVLPLENFFFRFYRLQP